MQKIDFQTVGGGDPNKAVDGDDLDRIRSRDSAWQIKCRSEKVHRREGFFFRSRSSVIKRRLGKRKLNQFPNRYKSDGTVGTGWEISSSPIRNSAKIGRRRPVRTSVRSAADD